MDNESRVCDNHRKSGLRPRHQKRAQPPALRSCLRKSVCRTPSRRYIVALSHHCLRTLARNCTATVPTMSEPWPFIISRNLIPELCSLCGFAASESNCSVAGSTALVKGQRRPKISRSVKPFTVAEPPPNGRLERPTLNSTRRWLFCRPNFIPAPKGTPRQKPKVSPKGTKSALASGTLIGSRRRDDRDPTYQGDLSIFARTA